jgi:carboxylesterase type B
VTKNWYNASAALGCGGATQGAATVDCVRTKSTQEILNAILPLQETALASGFAPIADDVLVPADPTAQGNAGNFSKLPILTGNTDNEASFFVVLEVAYTNLTQAQFNSVKGELALIQPLLDAGTLVAFTCPTSQTANFRAKHGVPVWRYRYYGGNYTNTYISGAGSDYHTSELPIVFGTASEVTGVPDTPAEEQAGPYIRNVWSTFARTGSLASLGWPQYNANSE